MRGLLIAAVVCAAWEAVVRGSGVSSLVVAAPSEMVAALTADWTQFADALRITLTEVIIAGALASVIGVSAGVAIGAAPAVARPAVIILSSLFAVPMTTLYPLFIAWFGLGSASKVAVAAILGFFPIALNTTSGVRSVDPQFRRMARAIGANRLQTFTRVVLPMALPAIASGLKVGSGLVVIGVLSTEVIASLGGLGYVIAARGSLFDLGHVYAAILLSLGVVFGVNRAIQRLERRLGFWRDSAGQRT